MIANLVASRVIFKRNILSNPVALLALPGGNLDGVDTISTAARISSPTTYYAKLVYRHDRINSSASIPVLFKDVKNGIGCYLYINATSNSAVMRVMDGVNAKARGITFVIGQTYALEWVVRSFAVGAIDCDLIVNGDVLSNPSTTTIITSDGRFIGSGSVPGTGKIPYLKTIFNASADLLYAPAIYGQFGTDNCGNGWTLTDGSPATFWT